MKKRTGFRFVAMGVPVLVALMVHPVQAATYLWDGGGSDDNWSTAANWSPDSSVPASANSTVVQLDGIVRLNTVQNVASPFVLNRLDFNDGPSSGMKSPFAVGGTPLRFVADGATQPLITNPREATDVIDSAVEIPAGTTLNLDLQTWALTFNGIISGEGAINKVLNFGGLNLNNGANSFSGGLTIHAGDGDWHIVSVNASGAMGTGPVNLYGGTIRADVTFNGGLMFFNATSHTNAISLFQDSPISVGDQRSVGTVTLAGPIDLNAYALYLRGMGNGTITGAISEGGADAIHKIDAGTWMLSGANTFAGRVTIANGALKLGAANALNAAVPLALSGGSFDLNGYSQTVSQLLGDATAGSVTTTGAAATLTVNQNGDTLFNGSLTGALGLVKAGGGSLTLNSGASTLSGDITVSNGTLVVAAATGLGGSTNITVAGGVLDLRASGAIADTAALRIDASGAKVSIGAGITETLDKLFLGGAEQAPGTYGAVGSGADTETDAFFGGSGKINVLATLPPASFVWDGGATDDNWSSGVNWNPDNAVPVSLRNTIVQLDGTARLTPAQDLADSFVLNRLDFNNGTSSGVKTPFALSGGALRFAANGTTQPLITNPREAMDVINNAVEIPAGTTLNVQVDTWGTIFNGAISGGGAIDKLQNAGYLVLNNGANSFSGGLTIRAEDGEFFIANVNASGAMGTGPVRLYGGAFRADISNIGGLIFGGTTSHTNPISLFQNSTIGAGGVSSPGTVTLNGDVDLNAYTLYLRGCGAGTLCGVVSEGGSDAIRKLDKGAWTLSAANTFTGCVTVADGTLRLGAANAISPAVPLTVSGGTYDLGGFSVSNSSVAFSAGSIVNGSLQALSFAATDTGFVSAMLAGASGIAKSGAGTLTLYGPQAFTGPLAVTGGAVRVQPTAPVPGSALWFDAANPLSLAKNSDGSGGTPAPGDEVGRWISLRGGICASTEGSSPTYQTNVVNGLPVLRFAGSGLYFNSAVAAQGSTVFLVYRDRNPTGYWRNVLGSEGQTPTQGWLHSLNNLNTRCLTKGGGAIYLDSTDPGTEWAVQTMSLEAGNYCLWVNEKGYGPDTRTATFTPFTGLGDGGLSADFAEVLVYTNLMSEADRVNTIRYLRRKWLGEGQACAVANSLSPQVVATVKGEALLNLGGGAQTFASLSGSGTVTGGTVTVTGTLASGDSSAAASALTVGGDLTLAAGVTNAVDYVSGASDVVHVAGTLSVAGSGTVALSLNGQPPPEQITLFTFGTIAGDGHLASWNVAGDGLEPYQKRVKVVDNAVVLKMFRGGAMVILR